MKDNYLKSYLALQVQLKKCRRKQNSKTKKAGLRWCVVAWRVAACL
jgi:hypothetical protein